MTTCTACIDQFTLQDSTCVASNGGLTPISDDPTSANPDNSGSGGVTPVADGSGNQGDANPSGNSNKVVLYCLIGGGALLVLIIVIVGVRICIHRRTAKNEMEPSGMQMNDLMREGSFDGDLKDSIFVKRVL